MRHAKFLSILLPALALLANAPAQAQAPAQEQPQENPSRFAVTAGVDWVTHYFFRGILQEDKGIIVQPYAEIGIPLFEGDGAIRAVSLSLGTWNSVHDRDTGGDSDTDPWYESDLYAGLNVTMFERWEAGLTYHAYVSPNSAFDTVQEIDLSLGYDDSHLWEGVNIPGFTGLSPSITFAFETDDTRFGSDTGTYFELSFGPSFTLIQSETMPVTLSVPVVLGFGVNDYYESLTTPAGPANNDDGLGFVDVGLIATLPLPFVPESLGNWRMDAGVHLLFLTNDELEAHNHGDDFEVIGKVGVSALF